MAQIALNAPSLAPRHRSPFVSGLVVADLNGGREPRRSVRARLRAYRIHFASLREGR